MHFASDNCAGVPNEMIRAVTEANRGYQPSYGADPIMDGVRTRLREVFEAPEAEVYLVATGTAANALSIALYCPPWGTVYCHEKAHIETDECGAPEFYIGGGKLKLVPGDHGRMTPETLARAIRCTAAGDVHSVQPAMISLTNTTEAGTVYSPADVAALTAVGREYGLPCHMDGARFANALVSAGCTPAEMTWKAGIDVLSFGGTKNGCLGVEAVVIFDPAKSWEFELRRKRAGHLFSKHRFLSAQMAAYLKDDFWLRNANHANARAAEIAAGLSAIPNLRIEHPVEANILFVTMPEAIDAEARAAGLVYNVESTGNDRSITVRFVTSWSTTAEDVAGLLRVLGS